MGDLFLPSFILLLVAGPQNKDPVGSLDSQVDFACFVEEVREDGHLLEVDDAFRWISFVILRFVLVVTKHSFVQDKIPGLPHFDDHGTLLVQDILMEVI